MGAESESWPGMVTSQSRSVTCLGMEVRQRSKDLHHCYSFCRAQLGKCTECRNSWYSQASCTWQLLKLLSHLRTGGAKIPSNSASILGWGHRPLLYWLQKGKINLVLGLFSIRKKKKKTRGEPSTHQKFEGTLKEKTIFQHGSIEQSQGQ